MGNLIVKQSFSSIFLASFNHKSEHRNMTYAISITNTTTTTTKVTNFIKQVAVETQNEEMQYKEQKNVKPIVRKTCSKEV